MARTVLFLPLATLVAWSSCASSPVAASEREQAERRLLQPYVVAREVGCGELRLEITGNFHGFVGRPAVDPMRHRQQTVRGEGYVDTIWTNLAGAPEFAFVVTVGEPPVAGPNGWVRGPQTKFRVVQQVVLRTYEDRRPLQLDATASGDVVVVKDSAAPPRQVPRFVIASGVVQP